MQQYGFRGARDGKRKTAIDEIAAPAEIIPDRLTETSDEVIGRAPADELRQAEEKDGAAQDQTGNSLAG